MASDTPTQERVIDSYSSYDSDIVDKLTINLSREQNCLLADIDLQVTANDTTSVIVSTGYAFQDNVLLHITSQHTVNFYDSDHYVSSGSYPENGYNYVVLNYNYTKSRPAPQASIKILKPSQRSILSTSSNFQLLKVVKLEAGIVQEVYDYDPDNTDNKRTTVYRYGAAEPFVPVFSALQHESKIIYDKDTDTFYFGVGDRWLSLDGSISIIKDTTGLARGDLVYVTSTGDVQRASSSAAISIADGVVTVVGSLTSSPQGRIQVLGRVSGVPIESSVVGSVNTGNLLYLSSTEDGKVTNNEETDNQFVGRCLNIDSTSLEMLFVCKEMT